MATRNRTILYRRNRDALKSVRVPSASSASTSGGRAGAVIELSTTSLLKPNGSYTPLSTEDPGTSSTGTVSVGLPPAWVDVSEEIASHIQRVRGKMTELAKAHAKALMPSFGDGKEDQRQIESLTLEITDLLKKSEKRLQRLSAGGPSEDSNIRKNVQRSLATDLQTFSMELRKKQSAYLKRLRQQKEGSDGVDLEMNLNGSNSRRDDDDMDDIEAHDTPLGGHAGVKRTLVRLSSTYFWPKMRTSVELHISSCIVCQSTKYSTQPPFGLLQPIASPAQIWEAVTMDFITGLPRSNGYSVILVVVDRLSKAAHFGPLAANFSASKTATLFADIVVKHHGFPASIISDRDPIFLSGFWLELFKLCGTRLNHSSAYHPQSDGQTKVVNRSLEQYLRAFSHERPSTWSQYLGWAEYCHNTSFNASIRMTPFQAVYGRLPPSLVPYSPGSSSIQAVEDVLIERDDLLRQLKENLRQAQERMRQQANKKRKELELSIGDLVLVKLQPYRQTSLSGRPFHKLSRRYYGPFKVVARIGKVAYRVDLPAECKIHPVFHISVLRPYRGELVAATLPNDTIHVHPLLTPTAIVDVRKILKKGIPISQALVQWEGLPPENATWEDIDELSQAFPQFHLEDKVNFNEVGNDTTGILKNGGKATATKDITNIPTQTFSQQPISTLGGPIHNQAMEQDNPNPIAQRPVRNRRAPAKLKDYVIA